MRHVSLFVSLVRHVSLFVSLDRVVSDYSRVSRFCGWFRGQPRVWLRFRATFDWLTLCWRVATLFLALFLKEVLLLLLFWPNFVWLTESDMSDSQSETKFLTPPDYSHFAPSKSSQLSTYFSLCCLSHSVSSRGGSQLLRARLLSCVAGYCRVVSFFTICGSFFVRLWKKYEKNTSFCFAMSNKKRHMTGFWRRVQPFYPFARLLATSSSTLLRNSSLRRPSSLATVRKLFASRLPVFPVVCIFCAVVSFFSRVVALWALKQERRHCLPFANCRENLSRTPRGNERPTPFYVSADFFVRLVVPLANSFWKVAYFFGQWRTTLCEVVERALLLCLLS